jgi:hypothetical protein
VTGAFLQQNVAYEVQKDNQPGSFLKYYRSAMYVLAVSLPVVYFIHTILFGFTCSALWKRMLEKREESRRVQRKNRLSTGLKMKEAHGTWATTQFEFS